MKHKKNFETLEFRIALFLRWGVLFAGGLMLLGWLGLFSWNEDPLHHYTQYDPISFLDLFGHHLRNKEWAFLLSYAGLAWLISLPLIRVFLTFVLFIRQRELVLATIAFVVLLGLVGSMLLGIEL